MALLHSIWQWWNPTYSWVEDASVPLEVDLDTGRLSGVGFGEPVERLAFLGPGWVEGGEASAAYRFRGKGLEVNVEGTVLPGGSVGPVIRWYQVFFQHVHYGVFGGVIQRGGRPAPLSAEMTEAQVRTLLGPPHEREAEEEDEGWVHLIYDHGEQAWELSFDPEGRLYSLNVISSEPALPCTPLASKVRQEQRHDGVEFRVPPLGLWTAVPVLIWSAIWLGGWSVGIAVALTQWLQKRGWDNLLGLMVLVLLGWGIGFSLVFQAVSVSRRRAKLTVAGDMLWAVETGILRVRRWEWTRKQIADIRAVRYAKGRWRLEIESETGRPAHLLAERRQEELAWIAAVLRQALHLPEPELEDDEPDEPTRCLESND